LTDQNDVNKIELAGTLEDSPVFILNEQTETEEFYDNNLYPLYGMALFLVIYTIAYSVFQMLVEKKSGIWDRIILSPAKKWEMYTANFIYNIEIVDTLDDSSVFILNEQTEKEEFYDNNLYPLYGMALFLVIYTIAYSVFQMLVEKKSGIWDRIILSPAKKWEMYTANFIY